MSDMKKKFLDILEKVDIPSKTKEAISELREINTILTEISSTNDKLSKSDLSRIGNDSFDLASKYGKNVKDYLSAVQKASDAGYADAMGIAELSVAAQNAGGITDELADKYLASADKAYNFGGSVQKLTEVLEGSYSIASQNAIHMAELAEGMSIASTEAASLGIGADETAAVLGTMIATTQQSGSEAANALKTLLLLLQQVTSEEDGIDAEGLARYENACRALNVSLRETQNGVTSLRDPMAVIRDLSAEYSKLDSGDARKINLLDSVGGNSEADAFQAILENYSLYEEMLQDYANSSGSIEEGNEKIANSWEGSMNRLSNTWTDTVGNFANSDAIIAAINGLNSLLSVVNTVTDKLGSFGSIGLGAGLFASMKNFGRPKMSGLFIVEICRI